MDGDMGYIDVNEDYIGEDVEMDGYIEDIAIRYDDTRIIIRPSKIKSRIKDLKIADVRTMENVVVQNKGGLPTTTTAMKPIKELFSSTVTDLADHNLYHVTSFNNAKGIYHDHLYYNDLAGIIVRPSTKKLKGINVQGFIYQLK